MRICEIIQELNLSFWLGYTSWEVTFRIDDHVYTYTLNDPDYHSMRRIYSKSKFKALNYAKKHSQQTKKEV